MTPSPKVSVIIPCFNTSLNIDKTIRAFLEQGLPRNIVELILIDDCSTDLTASIIQPFATKGDIIFLKNKHNSGRSKTRNRGLDIAQGEIIIFSDGDTVPNNNFIQKHVQSHVQYPKNEYVVVGAAEMPQDMRITPLMHLGNVVAAMQTATYLDEDPYGWLHFSTFNISLKREFIGNERFDENRFTHCGFEDTEFAQRLSSKGMRLVHNPEIKAAHYHFRSPDEYIDKTISYGKMYANWISECDPKTTSELDKRLNYLLNRNQLFSFYNVKEILRRICVNDLTAPIIRRTAQFFEMRNETISLFLYSKMHNYLFLKGFKS